MAGDAPVEVTVVVPTRDRWHLLATHALPSALSQVDVTFEVVVVDDGSNDQTWAGLAAEQDGRLRSLRHSASRGVSAARNTAIAAARGEWIAFLDDDDLWAPWKLTRQLEAARRAGSPWAYGGAVVVGTGAVPLYAHPLPDAGSIVAELERGNVVPGGPSNVIARTELVRSLGGFDECLSQGEDWDVWLKLARTAPPAVCNEVLVATLSHADRSFFRYRPNALSEIEQMLGKHRPVTRADRLGAAEWLAGQYHHAGERRHAAAAYLRAALRYRSPGNLPAALGALGGERGMRLASRLLLATRGRSHLEPRGLPVPAGLDWLDRYRTETPTV
jgi:glycosyltransferase involved in cell wall biosynthesis